MATDETKHEREETNMDERQPRSRERGEGSGAGKMRAQMEWDIHFYTKPGSYMAFHHVFPTLWQLLRLEKILPEEHPEVEVGETVARLREAIAGYAKTAEEACAVFLERDDAERLREVAREMSPLQTWRAEGRTPLGIRLQRALTRYAEVERLSEAAIQMGDDAESVHAAVAPLRNGWYAMTKGLRRAVYEFCENAGLENPHRAPPDRREPAGAEDEDEAAQE